MANQVQKKSTIGNFLASPGVKKQLEDSLGDNREAFVNNLIAMVSNDNQLQACNPKDLFTCALNATSLNLPLNKNLGYAYIIPYKGVPSFQIGYKGLVQLAIRTGAYEVLNACDIRDGEIKRNKITGAITFIGDKPENKIVGYLAYLKLKSGFSASLYMSEEEIEAHALRFSSMYKYDKSSHGRKSKWSDPLARPKMALKTVLKGLLGTYGVMTTDLSNAMSSDNDHEATTTTSRGTFEEVEIIQQGEPTESKPSQEPVEEITEI